MSLRALLAPLCLAAALSLPAAPAGAQCSMCRATVERSDEGRRVAGQLNQAILLMFLAPYAVFGACATFLLRRRIAAFVRRHAPSARAIPAGRASLP